MLSKPFSMVLVFVVAIANLLVLLSPFLALLIPFIEMDGRVIKMDYSIFDKIGMIFCLTVFFVSFLMLVYLFLDYLFGFSVKSSLKNCVRYEKLKDCDFLTDLFDQIKAKFGCRSVKLYIKNSEEINAYAVSSLRKRCIVLTRGIIHHYSNSCDDPKDFLYALRSIMGHEMSHLVNKDFLPALIIITNQKVTNFISRIMRFCFAVLIRVSIFFPFAGRAMARVSHDGFLLIDRIVTFFNRVIVYNLYEFLRKFVSRSIEYRCDIQSAKAFGGRNMALALAMLGSGGYFTLFSTHPRTQSRINRVEKISISGSIVRPRLFDSLANYFSLMLLVTICLYFAKQAHIDLYVRYYIREHDFIHSQLSHLWHLIVKYF
ncbi:MAG: M48 family metalloprotease [Rickettsiales bacterium]|nr:M48 family metalloprotease [Rickettsiales bacterium]